MSATVLDMLHYLQAHYKYVYVRRWDHPEHVWAAWVAEDDEDGLRVLGFCSGPTQYEAMAGLLKGLEGEPQPSVSPA